jgi:ferritin
MLKKSVQDALNAQINMELSAFYTYLSMSAFFESQNRKGFAGWLRHHAEEEMEHAMKLYDFIHARRGEVTLATLKAPPTTWETPQAAVESALHHEEKVTASIHKLVALARSENDFATDSFLQWFVDEQVEEEEVVDDLLQKLKQVGDHAPSLYLLDRDLLANMAAGEEEDEDEEDED